MINYNFPIINSISDVLPHIEGRDEFKVMRKDWYTVVNYMVAFGETFDWDESDVQGSVMRRECRGLIFDTLSGKLLSRPYHKFFNVGERAELAMDEVDMSANHVILEKLDGSMIRPIAVPGDKHIGEFRLGTKAGITDVAMNAEVWVAKHRNYVDFIRMAIDHDLTPVFEWCSRKNRIVVDYPVDRLVLTAVRVNSSGGYIPHRTLQNFAKDYDLDLVKVVDSNSSDINGLVDTIRAWESDEGVVVRFDAPRATAWMGYGHMLKIKADAYVTLHRSKDAISNEKNIVGVILNDQIDDLVPILTESDTQRLRGFQRAFWMGIDEVASDIVDMYLAEGVGIEEQREFANRFVKSQPAHLQPFLYGLRKGKGVRDMLIDSVTKSISSQGRIDASRWMWGGLKWSAV
jgi:RNA ligase